MVKNNNLIGSIDNEVVENGSSLQVCSRSNQSNIYEPITIRLWLKFANPTLIIDFAYRHPLVGSHCCKPGLK